ncbi:lysyl oxidase homolog 2 isoform X2 [Strongylocentrotus purpuratus]|uniref:SRCR domain-containing protein n=1 Tax=Strongylocentrotus purpuratus TaxID=7668 RepID=A0A7M7N8L8_STRPU|nr:lysyl oxidase homolog 2 isoform X2 [Strongylocentrotus purpuratus]
MAFFHTSSFQLKTLVFLVLMSYKRAFAVDSSVRLDGGSSDKEGFVQINVTGEWGNICSDGWDALDALVTCRQLGFTEGYAMFWSKQSSSHYWDGTTPEPTFLTEGSNFACNGNEETLLSCKYTKQDTYCPTLATVTCGITAAKYNAVLANTNLPADFDSRQLINTVGTSNGNSHGQLLVTHNNNQKPVHLTGGVCDMDQQAAMLICDAHGYSRGGEKTKVPTPEGLPMFIGTITCLDSLRLDYCKTQFTSTGVCPDGIKYNGVQCFATVDSSVRLYGGSSDKEGFVQINVTGEWRYICNDGWDALDALVTCRQLGFTEGYAMFWSKPSPPPHYYYHSTPPPEPTFLTEGSNFACNGNEETLLSCKYTKHDTYCSTLATVACGITAAKYNEVLVNANIPAHFDSRHLINTIGTSNGNSHGQLLVTHNNNQKPVHLTGGVCDMDQQAAMLICDAHGYSHGGEKTKVPTPEGLPMFIGTITCLNSWGLRDCKTRLTSTGVCPDGIKYNGLRCYTTERPSVIGAFVFAGVSSILILIAGACGVHWIRKDRKIPHAALENEPDDVIACQSDSEP